MAQIQTTCRARLYCTACLQPRYLYQRLHASMLCTRHSRELPASLPEQGHRPSANICLTLLGKLRLSDRTEWSRLGDTGWVLVNSSPGGSVLSQSCPARTDKGLKNKNKSGRISRIKSASFGKCVKSDATFRAPLVSLGRCHAEHFRA